MWAKPGKVQIEESNSTTFGSVLRMIQRVCGQPFESSRWQSLSLRNRSISTFVRQNGRWLIATVADTGRKDCPSQSRWGRTGRSDLAWRDARYVSVLFVTLPGYPFRCAPKPVNPGGFTWKWLITVSGELGSLGVGAEKGTGDPSRGVWNIRFPGFSAPEILSQNFPRCPKRFPQGKTGQQSGRNPVGTKMLGALPEEAPEL